MIVRFKVVFIISIFAFLLVPVGAMARRMPPTAPKGKSVYMVACHIICMYQKCSNAASGGPSISAEPCNGEPILHGYFPGGLASEKGYEVSMERAIHECAKKSYRDRNFLHTFYPENPQCNRHEMTGPDTNKDFKTGIPVNQAEVKKVFDRARSKITPRN